LNGLWTDVRTICRALIKACGFSTVAVLTLATGFTLCFTVLTVANAFLIRPLPYPDADRLYNVEAEVPGRGAPSGLASVDWSPLDDVVQHAIGWDLDAFYIRGRERTEMTPGAWVTPGFLPGLGIGVSLGRAFEATDFERGAAQVALISDQHWDRRFGRDPGVIGSTLRAYVSDRPDEAEAFTIVGVLPADFWHVNIYTDVLAPLRAPSIPYLVRLREGVAPQVAAERMTALAAPVATAPPGWRVTLTPMRDRYLAETRPILSAVATASAIALFIACANVAVLLLVRGTRRRHEIAVRLALGAGRWRIARLLMLEALVLGGLATVVGVLMSLLAIGELGPVLEGYLGRRIPGGLQALTPDGTVVLGGILLCLTTVVACGLAPLLEAWRLSSSLAANGRSLTDGPRARRTQSALIAAQVGASLTLLAGSALMVDSSVRMLRVDFGFQAADIVSANVALRQRGYPDAESRQVFFRRLLDLLEERTGRPAAAGDWWPLQGRRPRKVEAVGAEPRSTSADVISATTDYFDVLGLTVVQGTAFNAAADRPGGEAVAIVSATLADRLWPGTSVVGQRLRVAVDAEGRASPIDLRVVGAVNDVRGNHADADMSDLYVPWFQRPGRMAFVYMNGPAPGQSETLRKSVAELDAEASVGEPVTLGTLLDLERVRSRLLAGLLSAFGACAAVLALIGIYGAVMYSVRYREREIGLRIALGAAPGNVAALFVRQGSVLLLFGLVPGVLGALAIGTVLRSQRFGTPATDPLLIAGTAALFAACGLLATWWPARRASRIDPAVVLKDE